MGTGGLGSRVWSGPAITVTGIDVPSVAGALNAVSPHARAKLNLRVHPAQDAAEAQAALVRHLEAVRPFGVALEVHAEETGNGFAARTTGPAYDAARTALSGAWGRPVVNCAGGGSIPLVSALAGRGPGRRGAAGRRHRQLLEHPRARRARAARRAREGDRQPRRRSSASSPRAGASDGGHGRPTLAAAGHAHAARARRHRARRQQDAGPGDPLPVAVPGRDRALAGAGVARRQGHLRGRRAAAGARRGDLLRRLDRPRLRRPERARAGRQLRGARPRRPRSRAC